MNTFIDNYFMYQTILRTNKYLYFIVRSWADAFKRDDNYCVMLVIFFSPRNLSKNLI